MARPAWLAIEQGADGEATGRGRWETRHDRRGWARLAWPTGGRAAAAGLEEGALYPSFTVSVRP